MKFFLSSKCAIFLIAGCLLIAPCVHAGERIVLKKENARAKENSAKASLKKMDLQQIDDPDARQAIREIVTYLNLQTKN